MSSNTSADIIIALSGGVDSAVTAALLTKAGWRVRGAYMRNWSDSSMGCDWEWDFEQAKMVARALGIEIALWDFEAEYRKRVFEPFLEGLSRGITPNPDVLCNRAIKFDLFLARALEEGASWIATGHYASVETESKYFYRLKAGVDRTKDQSYFLALLTQTQLARALFPLGNLTKSDVRRLARIFHLPNAARRDSFGICFIGEDHYQEFLKRHTTCTPGPIRTTDGDEIGTHDGLPLYTIGQRRGIGVGGGVPYYVVAKDMARNTLIVTSNAHDPVLYAPEVVLDAPHWISGTAPTLPLTCLARHRHLQPLQAVTVSAHPQGGIKVTFKAPQRAITPGQFLALYDDATVLGGGVIPI